MAQLAQMGVMYDEGCILAEGEEGMPDGFLRVGAMTVEGHAFELETHFTQNSNMLEEGKWECHYGGEPVAEPPLFDFPHISAGEEACLTARQTQPERVKQALTAWLESK